MEGKKTAVSIDTAVFLGFADELLPALGAGDGDLALASGDADHLTALGAVIVAVLAILQPVEELEELPVLLIAGVGVLGQGAADRPDHQAVGHGGQQQIDGCVVEERGNQAGCQAGAQDGHIQPVCAVTTYHKPAEPGSQLCHKLSKHRDVSRAENFFSILY